MKKIIAFMFIMNLFSFGLFAQENKSTNDSIAFETTVHDYGTIQQGSDGSFDFKFTNKGKVPLLLGNVQASCGCTIPVWPKEPIAAGKSAIIKVTYDTNRIGAFSKSITVTSNAVNSPVSLSIKGNVLAKK